MADRSILDSLCPDGFKIVDYRAFERAVRMAQTAGQMPESWGENLRRKPHVLRLWGLERAEGGTAA